MEFGDWKQPLYRKMLLKDFVKGVLVLLTKTEYILLYINMYNCNKEFELYIRLELQKLPILSWYNCKTSVCILNTSSFISWIWAHAFETGMSCWPSLYAQRQILTLRSWPSGWDLRLLGILSLEVSSSKLSKCYLSLGASHTGEACVSRLNISSGVGIGSGISLVDLNCASMPSEYHFMWGQPKILSGYRWNWKTIKNKKRRRRRKKKKERNMMWIGALVSIKMKQVKSRDVLSNQTQHIAFKH
jgi:hypothetical protein